MTDLPTSVDIREVGPRDGLQIEDPISTDDKTTTSKTDDKATTSTTDDKVTADTTE